MFSILARAGAAGISVLLLASAYQRLNSPAIMSDAAKSFLASLTAEQRAKAAFTLTDEERFNFHFIPRPRKGVPFKEMTAEQRHLAHALLSAGLSQRGYIKATTIMSLDEVLRLLEQGRPGAPTRDPEAYYFSVFGEPSENGVWGYRVEGHHVSLNFTLVEGKIAASPNFFGANPAEVRHGSRKGLRVLAREEDLARGLLAALTPEQKQIAVVAEKAYPDILTGASRKAALEGQPSGLSAAKMTARQRQILDELLGEYAGNFPDQVAQARLAQIKRAGANLHFAWAGVEARGGPHYYRVQAPEFLIEYDNTQNQANHIHSVWRDFNGDFGQDLLAAHYRARKH